MLDVDTSHIEYLRGLRFSYTEIAQIQGISKATLYWKLSDAGINLSTTYSEISDSDLDALVETIKRGYILAKCMDTFYVNA